MTTEPINLDIFSDPVCPWCLIAEAELDKALASRPDHPFQMAWHPFRLNPNFPREGMDRAEYMRTKFGDHAEEMARQVVLHAAQLGLEIAPVKRQPDTTDAHRLIHWAGIEVVQARVMKGLLRAHWQESRDIGDVATLADIADKAGMDAEMVRRLLATDADLDTINTRESHARERGISAVPTFIIGDQHVVSGSQPAELWQNVIDEVSDQSRQAG